MHLGSDLKWESPPGCTSSSGICIVDDDGTNRPGENLKINGKLFSKGIMTKAPSRIEFRMNNQYRTFKACVGVSKEPESNCNHAETKTLFSIVGDKLNLKVNGSKWITKDPTQDPTCFQLGIGNVSFLELHTHGIGCGLSIWANAAVFLKGVKHIPSKMYFLIHKILTIEGKKSG